MAVAIKSVSAEGFRGINKRLHLEFKDGVNILFGKSGTGKSSVINAVSWCFTGEFPLEKLTDEFKKEDAIVCKFHPKRAAEVKLVLALKGKEIVMTRSRKTAKSTTSGKSPLTLEIVGEPKPLSKEEAENRIEKIIGIKKDDFPRVFCLHQELIKDILSSEPEERSRVIDKLLGTIEVRELVEALDVKRTITKKLNSLQKEIDAIQRDKIQFAVNLKKIVNEKKSILVNSGLSESELTILGIMQMLTDLTDKVKVLATEYEAKIHELKSPEPELPKISLTLNALEKAIREIDRSLTNKIANLEQKKLLLESLLKSYQNVCRELENFGSVTLPSLEASIKELESRITSKNSEMDNLNSIITNLIRYKTLVNNLVTKTNNLKTSVKEIESKYGDEEGHARLIQRGTEELKLVQRELSIYSRYEQLINLTLEHLSDLHPQECPICNQQIDCQTLINSLQKRIQREVYKKISDLRQRQEKEETTIKELKESLEKLRSLRIDLESEAKTLNGFLTTISELLRQEVDVCFNFDAKINELSHVASGMKKEISSLDEEKKALVLKRENLKRCIGNIEEKEQQLQKELKSEKKGNQLIKEAEEEQNEIDKEINNFKQLHREKIDEFFGRLSRIKEVREYLEREDELTSLEKQLPHLSKFIDKKQAEKKELEKFGALLEAIRKAALEYEEELVSKELTSLSEYINNYYTTIVNHPIFKEVKLEIEKTEPLIYSFKAVGKIGETRLSTGLSNSQMNATAIALLLANNDKIGSSMPVIIMDDPTQSFDVDYKLRLAEKIAELSRKRQIIIATQDREFLESLEKRCDQIRIYEFLECQEEGPVTKLLK